MGRKAIREYFKAIYGRYLKASKKLKHIILEEFCSNTGYNRKYAIRKLNGPPPAKPGCIYQRRRKHTYGPQVISILAAVWEAAGYPCSVRLRALMRLWMPWIRKRYRVNQQVEKQLLSISARQIDRRLKTRRGQIGRRIYGRTKPGTLLKHHIPIKTDNWDIKTPGWTEVDTVSHSGNNAEGKFAYTINQTDILTTWVESRAVLGKAEDVMVKGLDEMAQALPFDLKGLDSDNGSEFVNWHLWSYCKRKNIQPFRGRPYEKDDNAHIEQKNWTHVRKLLGWDRYDTQEAVDAMNDLYRNELRLFMNLYMPSMKLLRKERIGSKVKRVYDKPQTPFERVIASKHGDSVKIAELKKLYATLNPFGLVETIENKLDRLTKLANVRQSPRIIKASQIDQKEQKPFTRVEKETLKALSNIFPGLTIHTRDSKKKRESG
jgi:transposase InsO family protein